MIIIYISNVTYSINKEKGAYEIIGMLKIQNMTNKILSVSISQNTYILHICPKQITYNSKNQLIIQNDNTIYVKFIQYQFFFVFSIFRI